MLRHIRTQGQALVEFALAATLIFFLLAAAVDIGLIMFSLQGLHNAAQEGATYGSRWLTYDAQNRRVLNVPAIQQHVRFESGDTGGIGFANLLDLNADGIADDQQAGVIDAQITVEMLADPSMDGDPTTNVATGAAENVTCTDASTSTTALCYVRVTVRSVHNMVFPFAPAFSRNVPLRSSYIMPVRDSIARGSTTTGGGTPTATPTAPAGSTPTPTAPAGSTPTATPTTGVVLCTVPTLVGLKANTAYVLWINAGFYGDWNATFSGNKTIGSQSLTANSNVACSSSISVSQ